MKNSRLSLFSGIAILSLSLAILVFGCRKNKATAEDTGYASDQVESEQVFNDIQTITDEASVVSGSFSYRTTVTTGGPCAMVTHSGDSIIIDFGTADCTCRDGRRRRGKIIVTYSGGNYATPGSVHVITFDNFYQNDNKITGAKTVTNMGNNSSGQPYFNIHVKGSMTRAGGGTVSAEWDRVRTWTGGANTGDIMDDVYEITGSGELTRANGAKINISITTPLVIALNCHWIEAGVVSISFGNKNRVLNFGDIANCDNKATLTLPNGDIRDIELR